MYKLPKIWILRSSNQHGFPGFPPKKKTHIVTSWRLNNGKHRETWLLTPEASRWGRISHLKVSQVKREGLTSHFGLSGRWCKSTQLTPQNPARLIQSKPTHLTLRKDNHLQDLWSHDPLTPAFATASRDAADRNLPSCWRPVKHGLLGKEVLVDHFYARLGWVLEEPSQTLNPTLEWVGSSLSKVFRPPLPRIRSEIKWLPPYFVPPSQ